MEPTQASFMRRALELARKGEGKTSPNPVVGAVLVRRGKVVGEGWHKKAGGPHAEIHALRQAGAKAKGADLYVTLEPCCHFGKTPPCTEALLKAGVRRVVIGMRDPNPRVKGKSLRLLRKAGVEVATGVLKKECEAANAVFSKYIQTGEPYAILKAAVSLDGKIATRTGNSQWITSPAARKHVHRLRARTDAILVGAGTVLADNPFLTARVGKQSVRHPVRVVLDRQGRVPLDANVFLNARTQKVLLATGNALSPKHRQALTAKGVDVLTLAENACGLDLKQLMRQLGQREITSVLIEGGGEVHASALAEGVVDRVVFFIAPILIGGRNAPGAVGGEGVERIEQALKLKDLRVDRIGPDVMIEGTPVSSKR